MGVQPHVHAPKRVPYEYVGSRDTSVVKEVAKVGNHVGARARSSRCRVALSPPCTIEAADLGEPGYLLLNRVPVLARGTQPRLQDHRRVAFTNAVKSQPVSAHVLQGILAISRRVAFCEHSPPCLQLLSLQAVAASVPTVGAAPTQKRILQVSYAIQRSASKGYSPKFRFRILHRMKPEGREGRF